MPNVRTDNRARRMASISRSAAPTSGYRVGHHRSQSAAAAAAHSVSMTATMAPVDWSFSSTDESPPKKPVIVGSGPAGLACAIMLAKRGWSNIQVYDRLGEPPAITSDEWKDAERSYLIGLNGRGQTALKALGVFDEVDALCADVTGRREWTPGSEESKDMDTSKKRGFKTKVIDGTKP